MFISYVDRVSISVAGLAMQREFGWSEATKGIVLWARFRSVCMLPAPPAAASGLSAPIAMRITAGLGSAHAIVRWRSPG